MVTLIFASFFTKLTQLIINWSAVNFDMLTILKMFSRGDKICKLNEKYAVSSTCE